MAFGDTATVLLTEKKLKIKWNTGVVVDEKPVYYNQTISVENDITPQEAYDIAFKLDWHPHKLYSCRNRIRKMILALLRCNWSGEECTV